MEGFHPVRPSECPVTASPPRPRARGARIDVARHTRGLLRLVYTNNPFYVVSAFLILWGLRASFDTGGGAVEAGKLMAGLAGYTLLLALAAWFLIRFGGVWEDVRTILLVVVLMLLAISISPDETLAFERTAAGWYLVWGLAFAVAVSEGLLWGMRLRLRACFRVPYYLILALFFLYPLALSPLLDDPDDPVLHWGLFGFSTVAGVIFLTLLPAVRRRPRYVRDSGSPWWWPWYPWTLFGLLAAGVCVRAYCLCVSFHPVKGEATIFGFYFLVPVLLAVNVLVLEIGLVSRLKRVMLAAVIAPAGLLAIAATASAGATADMGFLERFTDTLGAYPLFLTLIAVNVFYAVAAFRRVPYAGEALAAALAAFALCGPKTVDARTLVGWQVYGVLRRTIAGWNQIALGVLFFLLALIISLTKAGMPQRWFARRNGPE